jgi:type IV pilus assembly protein PilC
MALLSPQISTKELVPLCRQLATSHEAGIPVLRSLDMASCSRASKKTRETMRAMHDSVAQGSSLAQAAKDQGKSLPPFLITLLEAGETGGRLDIMLRDLADYYEDRQRMQRQIMVGMAYPALQLTAAWFLGTFALRLVNRMGGSSFDLMGYFRDYFIFQGMALAVFAVVVLVCIGLNRMGVFKPVVGFFTHRVWPISKVTKKFSLARFFRSMSLLAESGMNMKSCVINSVATVSNPHIQRDLLQALPLIAQGSTLSQAFAPCKTLTRTCHEMLSVGEESGKLDEMFMKTSQYHLDEASSALKIAATVMGVVIVLAVGLIIGYIVISFYMKLLAPASELLG